MTLEAVIEDFRPSLVIVDSLKRITHGSEVSENAPEFADNIYALKEIFNRYGASGILIHHAKKDKDAYGVDMARQQRDRRRDVGAVAAQANTRPGPGRPEADGHRPAQPRANIPLLQP